ncbi:MAG: hypothetical protein ABEI86_14735 [Halobacteriaceae archaeon]
MENRFDLNVNSNEVIKDIKAGLESAFDRRGIVVPDDESTGLDDANIKIQKFTYRVVEHYDIPVIRTWYRYGQFEPYNTLRPRSISPHPLDDRSKSVPSRKFDDLTRKDIEGYFLEMDDLEDDWRKPLFSFLHDNYASDADDGFRDIYLANVDILETLEKIKNESQLQTNSASYADELRSPSIDLWYEMDESEYFDDSEVSFVRDFLDMLQSALIGLASSEDPNPSKISIIRNSRDIYNHKVWPWPAMKISIKEAEGPDTELRNHFLPKGRRILNLFKNTFPNRFERWEGEIYSSNLNPNPIKYRSYGRDLPEELHELGRSTMEI